MPEPLTTRRRTARIAGLWYLLMAITGPVAILYAPSQVLVPGDAAATASRILEHEFLLRIGVVSGLACQVSFVFLVLALERLFEGVDTRQTRLMVALVTAAVPIAVLDELFPLAAIGLVHAGPEVLALSAAQRGELATRALELHEQGIAVVGLFWGLWLYPLGRLVMASGFIPRVIGILLIAACCAYLTDTSLALLAPEVRPAASGLLAIPMAVGELSMVSWLLIRGVR